MQIQTFLKTAAVLGLFCACSFGDGREDFRLQIKAPYRLSQWPDSTYLKSMDSILSAEVLKPQKERPAEVTMPGLVQAPPVLQSSGSKPLHGLNQMASAAVQQGSNKNPERFAERFQAALEASLRDPSLANRVKTQAGDDLIQILKREYGNGVESLPIFAVKTQISALNPGVNLEYLPEGNILLPKL